MILYKIEEEWYTNVNRNKRHVRFLKVKNVSHNCDAFGASMLGIVKCSCTSVLQGVWELLYLVLFGTITIILGRQTLSL